MDTDSVSSVPHGAPAQPAPAALTAMARLVAQTWTQAEPALAEMSTRFYGVLFTLAPDMRDVFPVTVQVRSGRLLRNVARVVQMVTQPADLVPFLNQLGRDYRKYNVESRHYEAIGVAMLAALRDQLGDAWTPDVERAWAESYTIVARTMQEAAAADASPATVAGRVTEHRRLSWDLALVTVQPDSTIPYRAGQYLSVQIPQRPRLWRYLSPASPPREDGALEFHVRAVAGGWVSRAIVSHCQSGDVWQLGPPLGRLSVDRESGRDVLMVAGGTGLAPLRALIGELSRFSGNPSVHLFYGGRTPDDLYDLDHLRSVEAAGDWLTVTPVLETADGLTGAETGTVAEAVTRRGAWPDHDILVSGSPQMIRATVSRMLVAGTNLHRIAYDPFADD